MTRVDPYYTTADDDADRVYHVCDNCGPGSQIKPENRRSGVGIGRDRCEVCDDLIKNGSC